MDRVESLKSTPVVGRRYLVPCVYGMSNTHPTHPVLWWPVFTPSHEDSKYFPRYRNVWKGNRLVSEPYFEADPKAEHHFHIDPRFVEDDCYTGDELYHNKLHGVIIPRRVEVEYRDLLCLREMPSRRLFDFGVAFIDDHKDKKIRAGKCPHKGVQLGSCPVVDGVVTCPAHGLRFSAETGRCLSRVEDYSR